MRPLSSPLRIAFALFAGLLGPAVFARAAVVEIPPVTITSLTHRVDGSGVRDDITIPGPGYTSSGFTARFGAGDVVRVRVQAPPGKMFRVHSGPPGATGDFDLSLYWLSQGGSTSHFPTPTVTFEGFLGTAPVNVYALAVANDVVVETWFQYVTRGDFQFTAFVVDIPIDIALAAQSRTYADVASFTNPAFSADASNVPATYPAMEIVDLPTAAHASTWGRLKALYR
jgi:hypothetical protein